MARSSKLSQPPAPHEEEKAPTTLEQNVTSNMPIAKPPELPKPEEPPPFLEKSNFTPLKPISHSPKISPSSIPNPNPSVTTTKQIEPSFSNYGGYIYSVPGFSAFQPVAYPSVLQSNTTVVCPNESTSSDITSFPTSITETTTIITEKHITEVKIEAQVQSETPDIQSDFEEKFTPEIIPAAQTDENSIHKNSNQNEIKLAVAQGADTNSSKTSIKDVKKKPFERFSLKTSIPISKIDMKCVTNPPDSIFPNNKTKKPFNPAFHTPIKENTPKIEIQSNVVIKNPLKEYEGKDATIMPTPSNSINTLINAAETIDKTELQFKKPDPKTEKAHEGNEILFTAPSANLQSRPIFNPINIETNNASLSMNTTDSSLSEPKNQLLFLQKNNTSKPKMLLTIQQQNPQVLLQRTNFDSKNLQAPSRPSGQLKKTKEDLVSENVTSSKVVSLKRMHQDNYDENDFENLITENQIYGNKIVVKEKSKITLQEQDLKNKSNNDKPNNTESKNVVIHPNFVYLGNVQFPANLMMIKNSSKVNTDSSKIRAVVNENKHNEIAAPQFNRDPIIKGTKSQDVSINKEIHILKANNNVIQTLSNKSSKSSDLVFQTTNPKVIMNPQIFYQVPMIVEADNKINQTFEKGEYPKTESNNKKELNNSFEHTKSNDKLFITCPYQMDSKLQPKIVITNIRPKITKIDEVSSLDIYEQRKKLRRLKYLSNRDYKYVPNSDIIKTETKKMSDDFDDIITPEKMNSEIYKEFTNSKLKISTTNNDNESDYEDDMEIYNSLIEEYGDFGKTNKYKENVYEKIEFLAHFKLASQNDYTERYLQRQEKILRKDAVACAYIAAGRIDCLLQEYDVPVQPKYVTVISKTYTHTIEKESDADELKKRTFLSKLKLRKLTLQQKKNYEKVWREIEKEKERRENPETKQLLQQSEARYNIGELDMRSQLEILTEIKKQVNENNNLIKKRLDSYEGYGESIKVLAEKNFSELNRLSIMADRSVKHFSGQNTRKRDLNPGFDSENIQKSMKTRKYYAGINIPNISNIISLKTPQSSCITASAQATSMDEPQNSAAGVNEMFNTSFDKVQDFSCQVDTISLWPGIEVILKTYKEYEAARKKEIVDLHKRNTNLRVESAHITRAATQDSERAKALLAERRNLANEENTVRNSIQWLNAIIDLVKNYEVK